jgi:NRPS condensation-like uncharacterized protein
LRRGAGRGSRCRVLRLDPPRFAALKAYGEARCATVNDILLAGFVRAIAGTFQPRAGTVVPFSFTVDNRSRLAPGDRTRIVAVSSVVRTGLTAIEGEGFDETLRRVVAMTDRQRASLWSVSQTRPGLVPLTGVAYKPRLWASRTLYAAMVALSYRPPVFMNIGILDESRLTFGGSVPVAANILGSVPRLPAIAQTVSTYRDELTVWMGFFEEHVDPADVERLLDVMDAELPQA